MDGLTIGPFLLHLTSSATVAGLVESLTPVATWFSIASFGATWLVIRSAFDGWRRIRQWRNPPFVTLAAGGGEHGSVTVTHHGSPAAVSVEGRIVSVVDSTVANPAPQLFDGLLSRGADTWNTKAMKEGDWAHVVISRRATHQISGVARFLIQRGKTAVEVPDSGAIVELRITGSPPFRRGAVVRQFRTAYDDLDQTIIVQADADL